MTRSIERRIARLESRLEANLSKLPLTEQLLNIIGGPYPGDGVLVGWMLNQFGELERKGLKQRYPELLLADRLIADFIESDLHSDFDPKLIERLRGRVSHNAIAAACSNVCKWSYNPHKVARIREIVGINDKDAK